MEDNKKNKDQQNAGEDKRVETPQPPQRKDPMNDSEANRDGDDAEEARGKTSDRKTSPSAQNDEEPPTTTTNRRSY